MKKAKYLLENHESFLIIGCKDKKMDKII